MDRRRQQMIRNGGCPRHAAVAALLLSACLCGCATESNPVTLFADPGQFQNFNCEQISAQRKYWAGREQELRLLMDKADQGAGGAVVNVLAYKADHVAAGENLKVLEIAARGKNCESPENWRSNSVVR